MTPYKTEPDLPHLRGEGYLVAHYWDKHWQQQFWELLIHVTPLEATISLTKQPVGSSAGTPQDKQ